MKKLSLTLIALTASVASAEARYDCGRVQRAHFGLPERYNVALAWADLPRTSAQPGAVVVQTRPGRALGGGPGGHVSRIVEMRGSCRALVADDKGRYERDICSRLVAYVMPGGGRGEVSRVSGHRRTARLLRAQPIASLHRIE